MSSEDIGTNFEKVSAKIDDVSPDGEEFLVDELEKVSGGAAVYTDHTKRVSDRKIVRD